MIFSRSSATAALAALLFLSTTSASQTECLRSQASEIATLASCGHEGSIAYCLSHFSERPGHCSVAVLATCFVNAGCTREEAKIEAEWTLRRCDAAAGDDEELGELRRRQRPTGGSSNNGGDQVGDQNDAPTQTQGGNNNPPATPAPAPTQQEQPAPTEEQSTEIVVVTAQQSTISSFSSTSTPLVCFTTTTVSTTTCPVQSTGPQSGKQTLPCFPTQVSFPTCAAGLLCKSDAQGNPVCMRIENNFTTSGVIIALFFAVAVTIAVAATCFFCCRERRAQSKLRKAAEKAAIAKAAALDKKRPSVGVRSVSAQSDVAPLMGGHPGQTIVYEQQGHDPFGDHNRMR